MIDVHLHGKLAKACNKDIFTLSVESPQEAIQAISIQRPEFRDTIKKGRWSFIVGPLDQENYIKDEYKMASAFGKHNEMHIMPAVDGAGDVFGWLGSGLMAGIGAIFPVPVIGTALFGYGLKAATDALVQMPEYDDAGNREEIAQRASFSFDKPVNTSSEGLMTPLLLGEMLAGSEVVSVGIDTDDYTPDQ